MVIDVQANHVDFTEGDSGEFDLVVAFVSGPGRRLVS